MNIDACYQLGYIVRTHGVKGQVIAFFDVDYPEDYEELESVFLQLNGKLVPFFIDALDIQPNGRIIIKFEDVDSIVEAEKLKNTQLYLPLENLPELDEDQFYFHEVIGYLIVDKTLGDLGTVKEIYEMPYQDLMAMDYQGTEVLIPIQDELILRADKAEKKLFVNLPEGLVDIYLNPTAPEPDDEDKDDDAV
ncbi:ribosome maturation factor RimM [Adhaeribacter aquaticus]|uniref:ribosome maturation factor RimM n=1 Tax=Adhaeribacter aquaticus TaxID=299567 RepID=UPI000422FB90|nr:ribosome maturation factor RimM [Adhaeribacter aquaticus]